MQKINRELLKQALDHEEQYNEIHRHYEEIIVKAASILLEITDPKYEVPSHVYEAADPFDQVKYMFKEMLQEYVE